MSLRQRLLLAVAAALLASFAAGTWITAWQAAHLVRAELLAALQTGQRSFAAIAPAGLATRDALIRFVSGFDGSRHVMAELAIGRQILARSNPAPVTIPCPAWFSRLASPGLSAVSMPVPGGMLRLVPLPASETGERWGEARRLIELLALSSALCAALCFLTTAMSLRSLAPLGRAIELFGRGQPGPTVPESGPPELARLAAAFNRMQSALARASHENRRLAAQLDRLAEEERAEFARDLHDEAGPLLFAITAWATAARMQAEAGDAAASGTSLRALEAASAELQHAMRGLLRRLRDSAPARTDLAMSLEELVAFWQTIRPQTEFLLRIEPAAGDAPEPARAALFRVAQEAVSNAIRHGNPARVQIDVAHRAGGLALTVHDDGDGASAVIQAPGGLGLVGMEERLHSLGGTLNIQRGKGWTLTAWAPAAPGVEA
jgi:two-component system sensor histidine kinase UhpB